MSGTTDVVRALRDGRLAVLPTDTVYGLACAADREQSCLDLYRLKGRDAIQPTAVLFATVADLLASVPGLDGRSAAIARALLPGPFTLVVPNPAGRFSWLSSARPETIGVRVPALAGPVATVVAQVGAVVATSANLPGEPDPRRLTEVPERILQGVAATLDGGELPGVPSTVIDLTGEDVAIVRRGAGDPDAAIARIAGMHTEFLPSRDHSLTREE